MSPDFREHSVAHYMEPLLAAHDRSHVELFAYAELKRRDAMTERLNALIDHWRPTAGLRDEDVARQVRDDAIDILVDLAGHSADNRLAVFALRPAPVQVSWLGFPGTTGLSAIDYRLTDDIADPPGAEADASETLIRLPRGFHCWRPPAGAAGDCAARAHRSAGLCQLQQRPKDQRANGGGLGRDLEARAGRLRYRSNRAGCREPRAVSDLRVAFARHGIAADRLSLSGWIDGTAAHLAAYHGVDVALDPFPYNGTTTTLEALWMGVPVVTLLGDRHAGRVGASLLHRIGAAELVARFDRGLCRQGGRAGCRRGASDAYRTNAARPDGRFAVAGRGGICPHARGSLPRRCGSAGATALSEALKARRVVQQRKKGRPKPPLPKSDDLVS